MSGTDLLLLTTLLVSLLTTSGIVYVINQLGLNSPNLRPLFEVSNDQSGSRGADSANIIVNQNVRVSNLVLRGQLHTRQIKGDRIELNAGTDESKVSISMAKSEVDLSAKTFSFGDNPEKSLSFRLPQRLQKLSATSGVKNLRVLRALAESNNSLTNKRGLDIQSDDGLDLIGSAALRVHAKSMLVQSGQDEVQLQSADDAIVIGAPKGVYLTALYHDEDRNLIERLLASTTTPSKSMDQSHTSHVCIRRDTGELYASSRGCR